MIEWVVLASTTFAAFATGGFFTRMLTLRATKTQLHAEAESATAKAADTITIASSRILDPLLLRIDSLEAEVLTLADRISLLTDGVSALTGQIQELGHEPRWTAPSPWPRRP